MKRIRKDKARKLYNDGIAITIVPCKVSPYSMWYSGVRMVNHPDAPREFDSYINEFEYYNCNNETGRYTAFYISEEVNAC